MCGSAICLVLYDKRFGLLQEKVNEEAMNFITAVKTVSTPVGVPVAIVTAGTHGKTIVHQVQTLNRSHGFSSSVSD